MYVWGVNSRVTKHSDYFVWKDTSQCVTRHCDDIVDKKRVNSCELKYLIWREISNQEIVKTPRTCSLGRADIDVILVWRFYLPGVEPGILRSAAGIITATPRCNRIKRFHPARGEQNWKWRPLRSCGSGLTSKPPEHIYALDQGPKLSN